MRLLELDDFKEKDFAPLKAKIATLQKMVVGLSLISIISITIDVLILLK